MTSDRGIDRRALLGAGAALGGLGWLGACGSTRADGDAAGSPAQPAQPLKLLILGGTGFLGPHVVERALERGHTMTLFNRGRTDPERFAKLEQLRGDRDHDLDALRGRTWDAVIDTSGYVPRHVRGPAELLAPSVGQYVFVSTCSVYADLGSLPIDESSRLAEIDDPTIERVDGETYGALKALCERSAEEALPGRTTIVRPGLIVGPGDTSDRFGYWPLRAAEGGEVLAPGDPRWETQFSDVRDLAAFLVHVIERRTVGVFNVDGPTRPESMGELLETCVEVAGSDARLTWVDWDFLQELGVRAWLDLPAWQPPPEGESQVPGISSARSLAAGLRFRPVDETVAAALEYELARESRPRSPRYGMTREREAEVLSAWRARRGA
ncbi:MAG TPA: NAD-dependent epimerase/dehydratase family protein [Planctomycetota bacterium]|nr:NAD-dependent epimerase/dehydratase family protein [Planctomycetota bacterium]